MCACAPVLPQTGGPGPAQTTPMTHVSANGAHRRHGGVRFGLKVWARMSYCLDMLELRLRAPRMQPTDGAWPRPGPTGPTDERWDYSLAGRRICMTCVSTLCYAIVLPGRKSAFRAGFWRTATGKAPKSALRPADRCRYFPGSSPPKSGPQGRVTARNHYCVR